MPCQNQTLQITPAERFGAGLLKRCGAGCLCGKGLFKGGQGSGEDLGPVAVDITESNVDGAGIEQVLAVPRAFRPSVDGVAGFENGMIDDRRLETGSEDILGSEFGFVAGLADALENAVRAAWFMMAQVAMLSHDRGVALSCSIKGTVALERCETVLAAKGIGENECLMTVTSRLRGGGLIPLGNGWLAGLSRVSRVMAATGGKNECQNGEYGAWGGEHENS